MAFGDLDVLTLGPVVAEVSEAFDLFWNAPMSIPIGALTGRLGQAASLDVLREQLAAFAEAQADSAYARQARSTAARGLATGTDGMFWGRGHVVVDDPAKVTRSALQNAAAIAGLFLPTEVVVADKPEKTPAMPGGGDGGMRSEERRVG